MFTYLTVYKQFNIFSSELQTVMMNLNEIKILILFNASYDTIRLLSEWLWLSSH